MPQNDLPEFNPLEVPEIVFEIAQHILENEQGTTQNSLSAMALSCRFFYQQSQTANFAGKLLSLVVQSRVLEVQTFLNASSRSIHAITHKCNVRDGAERRFNHISAFQYALWALDWNIWEIMLDALDQACLNTPTEEMKDLLKVVCEQYREVVDQGLSYSISSKNVTGESHYPFEGPEFCLMPDTDFKPEKGKIYVKIHNGFLEYALIDVQGTWIKNNIEVQNLNYPPQYRIDPISMFARVHHLTPLPPLTRLEQIDDIKPYVPLIMEITSARGETFSESYKSALQSLLVNNWGDGLRDAKLAALLSGKPFKLPVHFQIAMKPQTESCYSVLGLGISKKYVHFVEEMQHTIVQKLNELNSRISGYSNSMNLRSEYWGIFHEISSII